MALVEASKDTPGFNRAAEVRGRKLAIREERGLALMKPLARLMGVSREYFETDFGKDFGEKIANIPEGKLQTPRASIAGPVMEGLGYSLDEPQLKEMYLELLARAYDQRVARRAHPSFVEVIKQLTATEASYLRRVLAGDSFSTPAAKFIARYKPEDTYTELLANVIDLRDDDGNPVIDEMLPTYVDNWVRLSLVTADYAGFLVKEGRYEWVAETTEYEETRTHVERMWEVGRQTFLAGTGTTGIEFEVVKGTLDATAFGQAFAEVVGLTDEDDDDMS
ncbi:hypothetical protein BIU89_07500 [Curtobacterium sp. MCBA15_005]|nr:hypothetical protein BIU89_07500 [Curtobacterium sp. MCBA15_005]